MLYEESQNSIVKGELALQSGDIETARRYFDHAAAIQRDYVLRLPPEKRRTKASFGLSAASLFFRADNLTAASRLAYTLLASDDLDDRTFAKLEDLLSRIKNEKLLQSLGFRSHKPLSIILHGRSIGDGMAPQEEIDPKVSGFINLIRRFVAWKKGEKFTPQITSEIKAKYGLFAKEPVMGSYRVDLIITEPQLKLDLEAQDDTEGLINEALVFMQCALNLDEAVSQLVPDEDYRAVLLRLIGNFIPDGQAIDEVEIRRQNEPKEAGIIVRSTYRQMYKNFAGQQITPVNEESKSQSRISKGTLRAIDLDMKKMKLVKDDGHRLPLNLSAGFSEDVLEPLLNKQVVVSEVIPPKRKSYRVVDIELLLAA